MDESTGTITYKKDNQIFSTNGSSRHHDEMTQPLIDKEQGICVMNCIARENLSKR